VVDRISGTIGRRFVEGAADVYVVVYVVEESLRFEIPDGNPEVGHSWTEVSRPAASTVDIRTKPAGSSTAVWLFG
jgi:hypothetical protein